MKKFVLLPMLFVFIVGTLQAQLSSFEAENSIPFDTVYAVGWEQPQHSVAENDAWLYYDNNFYYTSIGYVPTPEGAPWSWAVMFPADSLQPYEHYTITKVSYFKKNDVGDIHLKFYHGLSYMPTTLLSEQTFATTGAPIGFMDIALDYPLEIDATKNLWVVFSEDTIHNIYPATCSQLPQTAHIDPNGRWGLWKEKWMDVAIAGWNRIQWMIRVYVTTDPWGIEVPLNHRDINVYPNPTVGFFSVEGTDLSKVEIYNLVGQKVYETKDSSVSIDASDWNKGMYLVRVTERNGKATTKKLVVN